jgi:hypothetical protein
MRRWGMVVAAILAVVTVGAGPVWAANKCKRSCAVFMRTTCRHDVKGGVKSWEDQCKSLFDKHTHKCLPATDCMGFANLAKCRSFGTHFGSNEGRTKCGKDNRKACQACCDDPAMGTIALCVHSPSGAFLDF